MRTFNVTAAQGDVFFRRVDSLPDGLVRIERENGMTVVAHSETGHNHVFNGDAVEMYRPKENFDFDAWLVVREPTALEHLRSFDTHESIMFEPGIYHVRRQREYVPEGFRRVED